jgi:hypothetical protein
MRDDYSRIYHSVVDDEKFRDVVFCDDHLFATWVRLLMVADAVWPASAPIPRSAAQDALDVLAEHRIIEVRGDYYRVVGLDAERSRRGGSPQQSVAGKARAASAKRDGGRFVASADPSALEPAEHQRAGASGSPAVDQRPPALSRDETSLDETSQDETSPSPASARDQRQKDPYLPDFDSDRDALDLYHELTLYRPWGLFSGDKLRGAIVEYGNDEVEASMRAEHSASADRETLLSRTLTRLARDAERKRITKQQAPKPRAKDIEQIDEAERSRILREFMEAEPWPSTPDAPSGSTSDSASEPETTTASTDT